MAHRDVGTLDSISKWLRELQWEDGDNLELAELGVTERIHCTWGERLQGADIEAAYDYADETLREEANDTGSSVTAWWRHRRGERILANRKMTRMSRTSAAGEGSPSTPEGHYAQMIAQQQFMLGKIVDVYERSMRILEGVAAREFQAVNRFHRRHWDLIDREQAAAMAQIEAVGDGEGGTSLAHALMSPEILKRVDRAMGMLESGSNDRRDKLKSLAANARSGKRTPPGGGKRPADSPAASRGPTRRGRVDLGRGRRRAGAGGNDDNGPDRG